MMAFLKFNVGQLNVLRTTESCLQVARMFYPLLTIRATLITYSLRPENVHTLVERIRELLSLFGTSIPYSVVKEMCQHEFQNPLNIKCIDNMCKGYGFTLDYFLLYFLAALIFAHHAQLDAREGDGVTVGDTDQLWVPYGHLCARQLPRRGQHIRLHGG